MSCQERFGRGRQTTTRYRLFFRATARTADAEACHFLPVPPCGRFSSGVILRVSGRQLHDTLLRYRLRDLEPQLPRLPLHRSDLCLPQQSLIRLLTLLHLRQAVLQSVVDQPRPFVSRRRDRRRRTQPTLPPPQKGA